MQVKKIVSAVSLAVAGMAASQSHAAMTGPEQAIIDDANANNRVVFIAGASATQGGLNAILATLFTGTPIRFANASTGTKNWEAAAGTISAAAASTLWPAGTNVIIIDRVQGGSVFGVDPVARPVGVGTPIQSLDVTSATCGATGSGTAGAPYVCTTAGTRIPDAGVSDVAPNLFKSPVNTEGESPADSLSALELAEFNSPGLKTPIFGLAFGVAVTNNVSVALNKSVVAGIMSGNVGTWSEVDSSLSGDIVICRRTPGSGTQAVFNMYFSNYACPGIANSIAERIDSGAWDDSARTFTVTPGSGALVIVENGSSGNVRDCLDKAATGGSYVTTDRSGAPVTVNFTDPGNKAIGVLSMDSIGSSSTAGNWSFRSFDKVDGRMDCTGTCPASTAPTTTTASGNYPTLDQYVDGQWDLQGWVSFQIPKRTSGASNTLAGAKRAVLNAFVNKAKDPAVLATINNFKWTTAAIPGGLYSGAQVLRAEYLGGDQCAPYYRLY